MRWFCSIISLSPCSSYTWECLSGPVGCTRIGTFLDRSSIVLMHSTEEDMLTKFHSRGLCIMTLFQSLQTYNGLYQSFHWGIIMLSDSSLHCSDLTWSKNISQRSSAGSLDIPIFRRLRTNRTTQCLLAGKRQIWVSLGVIHTDNCSYYRLRLSVILNWTLVSGCR